VDPLETAATEEGIEPAQAGLTVQADLNDAARTVDRPVDVSARFLGKEQRVGERIKSRAIQRVEMGQPIGANRRQKRDAAGVVTLAVEIDARDIGEVAGVFVALDEKIASVVDAIANEALFQGDVGVLVGLGPYTAAQQTKLGNDAARIFQPVRAAGDYLKHKIAIDQRRRRLVARLDVGLGHPDFDNAETVLLRPRGGADQRRAGDTEH
jgi:hypothetical protein